MAAQAKRSSDFVLIGDTRDYVIESLERNVTSPELLAAWRQFYKQYAPLIRRFAVSSGVANKELDGVVQTAWTIVVEDLPRFDCDPSKGSFRAWLFVRVRNASVNQIRERNRHRDRHVGVHFEEYSVLDFEPVQMFEQHWNEIVLHEALETLERYVSDLDYKLFVMRRFHDLSFGELAEDIGLREGTVRSKVHRTWRTFTAIFQKQGYRDLLFQCD